MFFVSWVFFFKCLLVCLYVSLSVFHRHVFVVISTVYAFAFSL